MELKLPINSGYVRDTQVWFGSLAGASEIKVPLPAYLTGKDAGQINPEEVQAVLTLAGSPFLRMTDAIHYLLNTRMAAWSRPVPGSWPWRPSGG